MTTYLFIFKDAYAYISISLSHTTFQTPLTDSFLYAFEQEGISELKRMGTTLLEIGAIVKCRLQGSTKCSR